MAYYEDLTPYNYTHYCEKELNVGWLQKDQPFLIGETPDGFLNKLKLFAQDEFLIHDTMGFHECEFCENKNADSSNELRVVGIDGIFYAAPFLIVHYVENHKYLPPQEFIHAVLNGPTPGSEEYNNVILRMPELWERRKPDINDCDYEEKMRKLMIDNMSQEVEEKIMKEIIEKNINFNEFVNAYNSIMPSVYNVNLSSKK